MLAVFGFTITGLLFALFALTLPNNKDPNIRKILGDYTLAYLLLAIAFIGYGIASAEGSTRVLASSMIFGNILIFSATVFILNILFNQHKNRKQLVYLAIFVAVILTAVRVLYFYPEPYMEDSILVFNSQRFVSFLLSAIFLAVWLPANLRVAKLIVSSSRVKELANQYVFLYTAATFAAVIFLLAKKPITLAFSFTAVSVAFLLLLTSNLLIRKAERMITNGK